MTSHKIVSREEWLEARKRLLAREKEFTHQRDALSQERRELPWVRVEKNYVFQGPNGVETLSDLFAERSQLVVYHFMFAPEWDAGCKSCSFWADNFNGITTHLEHRDVTLVAIARAPFPKLQAYERRMGWSFKWLSSFESDFNFDFGVSFKPEDLAQKRATYNYGPFEYSMTDMQGISTFFKDADKYKGPYKSGDTYAGVETQGTDTLIIHLAKPFADLPFFMIHGERDRRTPFMQFGKLIDELKQRGNPVEFYSYPEEAHGIRLAKNRTHAYSRMIAFFQKHLAGS